MFDSALFIGFPYVAVFIAIAVTTYRYFYDRYSYSSQSSQFLENRMLFFGSVPWHYGVITILLGHLTALLLPQLWGDLIANQIRLYILEVTGLMLALMATVGLTLLFVRRLVNSRAQAVTSEIDWILLADLLLQVGLGFWIAYYYRWGSDWYLHTAVPWLVSLVKFQPNIASVTALPLLVKLHFLNGFVLTLIFPFTRLVHFLTYPVTYLWRSYQVVIWNRARPG